MAGIADQETLFLQLLRGFLKGLRRGFEVRLGEAFRASVDVLELHSQSHMDAGTLQKATLLRRFGQSRTEEGAETVDLHRQILRLNGFRETCHEGGDSRGLRPFESLVGSQGFQRGNEGENVRRLLPASRPGRVGKPIAAPGDDAEWQTAAQIIT